MPLSPTCAADIKLKRRLRPTPLMQFFCYGWLCAGLGYLMVVIPVMAAESTPIDGARPKIGLVLSGGGARGAAHIGVLQVLERERIPIDYIAGTSMGSIIGGLYASGKSLQQIEQLLTSIDWADAFVDSPAREDRSFRRKSDDDTYLVKHKAGFNNGQLEFPKGLIQGQKIDLILKNATLHVAHVQDFDQLGIPFRAVATDIATGHEVVLSQGDLAQALRASMSIPGGFSPVLLDGKLLVDGGISNNLPISVVRAMGADIIIAVDISTPLSRQDQLISVLSITQQLSGILTRRTTEEQLLTLTPRDVLLVPDLGEISTADFADAHLAIPKGTQASEAKITELRALSVDVQTYAQGQQQRFKPKRSVPIIDFVRVNNRSRLSDDVLLNRIHVQTGAALDIPQLESDIGAIYGMELFESVRYELLEEDGKTGLILHVRERDWGPNYLQLGLALTGDFKGENSFNIGLAYTRTAINDLGGEWRSGLQLGESPGLFTEIHQPLDTRTRYFVAGKLLYAKQNWSIFYDAHINAEYRLGRGGLELATGREFGTWGEARIGLRRLSGKLEVRVGDPTLPDLDFDMGELFVRLSMDTLDDANFPHSGNSGTLEWLSSRKALAADTDYDQILLAIGHARSWGKNTLLAGVRFNTTLDENAPLQGLFRGGGFFNLSGLQPNQISGQHYGLLRAAYYRRINELQWLPTYLGATLEYGNVWQDHSEIKFDNLITAGSLFLGVDTGLGPLYFAYGKAEAGRTSLYMFLGRLF